LCAGLRELAVPGAVALHTSVASNDVADGEVFAATLGTHGADGRSSNRRESKPKQDSRFCRHRTMKRQSKRVWSDQDDAALRDCAARRWSMPKIALRLRRSTNAVERRARQLGVKIHAPARLPSAERALPG